MKADINSLSHFVRRWLEKANDVVDSTDSAFVDRFVFTYISFNALYTAAANILDGSSSAIVKWDFRKGGPPKRQFKKYPTEQRRATTLVVDVIGKHRSVERLLVCKDAIENLCNCFGPGRLYLHELESGEPDIARDDALIASARSGNIESLLRIVYLLRCNLFHGAKALSAVQDVPLTAATAILQTLIPPFLAGIERRLQA
jgi:hypothetical protein